MELEGMSHHIIPSMYGLYPEYFHTFLLFSHLCSLGSEKAMSPHSSTLAWKIPWTEEPGKLQSMGS